MASIYLIRHGQASFGTDNYDRLSELGCRQAEVLSEYLDDHGVRFDAVYTGELERQRKTAAVAAGKQVPTAEHRVDARFNEIDNEGQLDAITPILLEERPRLATYAQRAFGSSKDYQKLLEQVFKYWVRLDDNPPEGLQSWPDYAAGAGDAVKGIMAEHGSGSTVGVFTSGGTIATIVAQVWGMAGEATYQFYEPMINCSITRLLYNNNRVSVSYYNDHSFLDVLGRQRGEELISYR